MKLLIFDFDGTIADTKEVYYHAMFGQLKEKGFDNKRIVRAIDMGMSLRKTLQNLGLGFIVSWIMKKRIMKTVKKEVDYVKKCRDVSAIKDIYEKKIIVTNSLKEFAIPILRHLKLKKYFSEVYGADDFSDKLEFIRGYLKNNKIAKKECYYVGDRAADVALARKVGCVSVIVSGKCAWNSRQELVEASPDFLLSDIGDLKQVLQNQDIHA